MPPVIAAAAPGASTSLSQIVLCTGSGLRVVQLDKDGNPVAPGKSRPPQSCPICTALASTPLALSPSLDIVPVPKFVALFTSERRIALVTRRKPLVARGRDPPLQA